MTRKDGMAITILVLLEKIVPLNWHLGQVTGVILLAWGVWVIAARVV